MFQAATGRLSRKMNQCMETNINMVERHWPTISGITHWRNKKHSGHSKQKLKKKKKKRLNTNTGWVGVKSVTHTMW